MKKDILKVDGMTCVACSNTVEKYVKKQKGVTDASVNLILGTINVTYDDTLTRNDIAKFIEKSGYKYGGIFNPNKDIVKHEKSLKDIKLFGILLIIILYLSMGSMIGLPGIHNMKLLGTITFIFSIIYIYYGRDLLRVGFKSLIIREPNMDSLVFVGVFANFIYSFINLIFLYTGKNNMNIYFESICTIIYFVKLGELIEERGRESAVSAIKELVTMTPSKAHKVKKGKIEEVSIDEIKKGDTLCVKKGERFAVDGIITKGTSHADNSFVTGESMPVKIEKGSKVLASSINLDDYVEYKAENIGPNSTISEIVHMVMDSSNNKTEIEKKSDIVSSYFTKIVLLVSVISLVISLIVTKNINASLTHFVSVLVVACPCALGLASPLALLNANNLCLKNKILVRNNTPLIEASKVNVAIFDKTGTLTKGKIRIYKINNYSNISKENILEIISSLEHLSQHPIARVFDEYKYIKVKEYKSHSNGIEGYVIGKYKYYIGNSEFIKKYTEEVKDKDASFYLVSNKKILASIYIKDELREESFKVVEDLRKKNIKSVMLTGDSEKVAKDVAKTLLMDEHKASLLPKEKHEYIKELKKEKTVMMIGDGINDAPSLEEADVGISLKGSTSIATNSANVILLDNNLRKILRLIDISEKTCKIINENLVWAFIYNALMIPIACGLTPLKLSPTLSSIAMVLSSLSVVLNSLRLRKE